MIRKITIAILASVMTMITLAPTSSATSLGGFQAGDIIDNAIFTNANTMSVNDIQNFLNSKVPTCNTNHSGTTGGTGTVYNPPFTCLKDFYENPNATYTVTFNYVDTSGNAQTGSRTYNYNNDYQYTSLTPIYNSVSSGQPYYANGYTLKATIQNVSSIPSGAISAAQIIYNYAQQYQINPQVLIVLLQKEQGLVTDDWPEPWEYQSATGYGCPDTAPCSAGYSGFSNQIKWAATMFHAIITNSPSWYTPYILGNNYIQYNPVVSCGGTTVNIVNRATQALYNYTPYQPDGAALAAGYGAGDACSSYGNRNFYLYFSDWFGSTHAAIIRTYEDGAMYLLGDNNTYYHITSSDELSSIGYGISLNTIYNVSKSYLNNLTSAGDLSTSVRFNGGTNVYLLDSGNMQLYTYAAYTAYGSPPVSDLDESLMSYFYPGSNVTTVMRQYGNSNLYSIQSGQRHNIGDTSIYTSGGYSAIPITSVGPFNFNNIPEGTPILSPGTITKSSDTAATNVIASDGQSLIPLDSTAANSIGFQPYINTSAVLNLMPTASGAQPITLLAKDSTNNLYLLDGITKYNLSQAQVAALGKTTSSFVSTDQAFLNRFTAATIPGSTILVRAVGTNTVYAVTNGELFAIQTLGIFNQAGFSMSSVVNLQQNTLSSLLANNNKFYIPPDSLFRVGSSASVYFLDDQGTAHLIPTGDIFNDFGFSYANVQSVNTATFNALTQGPALQDVVSAPDGSDWAISYGMRRWIAPSLVSAYATSQNIAPVSASVLAPMPIGQNMTNFIRINQNATVYYVNNVQKTPLQTPQTFANYGGTSWNQVIGVSPAFAGSLATQPVAQ